MKKGMTKGNGVGGERNQGETGGKWAKEKEKEDRKCSGKQKRQVQMESVAEDKKKVWMEEDEEMGIQQIETMSDKEKGD